MFGNSIGILYSALLSDQKSLEIRNRNVANVNNPDYVKEEPVLQTLPPPGGVSISDVKRLSDEVLQRQMLKSLTLLKGYEEKKNQISVIQTYFDDGAGSGLGKLIDNFFRSVLQFLRDPQNEGAKENLLTNAKTLVNSIRSRYQELRNLQTELAKKIELTTAKLNTLTERLAKVNKDILFFYSKTKGEGNDYKNLLDERDLLLKELAKYVNIDYSFDKIGRVEVNVKETESIASGYISLVSYDGKANKLSYDSENKEFTDSLGIVWPQDFFKNGLLGAYVGIYNDIETFKKSLNALAKSLVEDNRLKLHIKDQDNIEQVAIFRKDNTNTDNQDFASNLDVNISKNDLDNYDSTKSDLDQDNIKNAWNTIRTQYSDFTAQISSLYTDYQIKYETERDLQESLETKYAEKTGVNLDEELAEIMKLQQHYQALSKMIATSTRLLDYILNAVR